MKKTKRPKLYEKPLSSKEFLEIYNENMPEGFPQASLELMKEFRETHKSLFKSNYWTLDQHRKRLIDWLPQNV